MTFSKTFIYIMNSKYSLFSIAFLQLINKIFKKFITYNNNIFKIFFDETKNFFCIKLFLTPIEKK